MRRLAPIVASLCALMAVAPAALADDICTRAGFATSDGADVVRFPTGDGSATTATIAGAPTLGRPAVLPDGTRAYVPDASGNRLIVVRGGDVADTGTAVTVGAQPTTVVVHPLGTRVYVLNAGTNAISAVDTASDTVVATAAFGGTLVDIALSTDGMTLYALGSNGSITAYATAGDAMTATSIRPSMGLVSGGHLAVAKDALVLTDATDLYVAPLDGGAVSSALPLGLSIADLAVDATGARAYVAVDGTLTTVAVATQTAGTPVAATGIKDIAVGPTGLVYGAQGTQIGVFSAAGASSGTPLAVAATHVAICPSTAIRPGVPTALRLTRGDSAIAVRWTAPTDGGAPITAYEVVATPGDASCTATSAEGCTVSGLRNGTGYRFKVRARNAVGWGGWSANSDGMQPRRDTAARSLEITPITVRTTRKATVFTTRVTTTVAGVLAQTVQIKAKRYCAMSRAVAGPGTYVVRCVMTGAGRRLVRLRRTTFTVRTTFTPRIGTLSADRRDVAVPRRR